ncbi:MAG TPA: PAS domain S-box protein, partial [Thermomicrobiales bacterium]|nr:PAS domain S-box protein [Thermomicrobiales bacterium]
MREPPPVPRADAREAAPRGPGAAPSGEQPGTSELQQRERRYRAIVDHAPIGIVTIDAGGEIISANRAFCDMVGYSTEELRAIPFSRLVPPADLDQAGERWVRLQKLISGEIDEFNSEARYVHKNGNTIWTCISLSAVRDDDGQFLHTVSMIEDITGQKTLEQRQQLLLDASAALSSSLDFETTLQQVARLSVHALADLCVVSLIDDAGAVRRVAAAHADPAQQALADTLQDDSTLIGDEPVGVAVALRTAATQLYEDFSSVFLDDAQTTGGLSVFKALNIRSMLIVPLIAKGTTIGAITFAYTGPARGYSTADTGIAEDLARRAAVAIDNARLHKMARDAETRFRGLVENLPAMVFVTSPDDQSTLLYQSPQIARLIGYQQDEWLADPRLWTKRLHPSDRARVLAAVEAAARSGEPLTLEYRFVRRDGSVVWMRDETALVRDDAGAELYWLGVTVDTTREKQAEERLRSSERRFRSLIQNAADITGILNVAGVIQFQSPAVEHTLGYRPGEMLDSHYSAYVHPDDAVAISRFVTEVIGQRGRHLPLTFRCRHGDGSWRWLEATITNFLGDPSIRGIVINARDITERMLAEQATRESQARFRSAFHDAAVGMAIIALDGRLIQVNPALCVMTEYSEAELLALADADISHPDDVSAGHELAGQFARGNIDTVQIEKRYLTRSGLSVWCVVNIAAVRDEQGAPLYLLAQAQDISERKELEAQLSHQALHDSLTGLPNRTLLLDRIDRELSLTRRHGGWVAVLFLDLDNFKVINDSL